MKKIHFVVVLIMSLVTVACGSSEREATAGAPESETARTTTAAVQFDQTGAQTERETWFENWDEAMVAAKAENKPVYVHFTADWCTWCKKMESETYTVEGINKRLSDQWISLKVDTENPLKKATFYVSSDNMLVYLRDGVSGYESKNLPYNEIPPYFGVKGLPTLLFIDKEGQPLYPLSQYLPANQLAPMLDYFRDELYKNDVDLTEYVKGRS